MDPDIDLRCLIVTSVQRRVIGLRDHGGKHHTIGSQLCDQRMARCPTKRSCFSRFSAMFAYCGVELRISLLESRFASYSLTTEASLKGIC